jgi:hypothetical protein
MKIAPTLIAGLTISLAAFAAQAQQVASYSRDCREAIHTLSRGGTLQDLTRANDALSRCAVADTLRYRERFNAAVAAVRRNDFTAFQVATGHLLRSEYQPAERANFLLNVVRDRTRADSVRGSALSQLVGQLDPTSYFEPALFFPRVAGQSVRCAGGSVTDGPPRLPAVHAKQVTAALREVYTSEPAASSIRRALRCVLSIAD